jgi:hypothetical protein
MRIKIDSMIAIQKQDLIFGCIIEGIITVLKNPSKEWIKQ